jgi:hypothetical protein
LRAEFGQERVRHHAGLSQRRQQRLAEQPLATIGIELVGLRRMRGHPAINELLLEGGQQLEAGLGLQPVERSAQHMAWTVFPGRALESHDVAHQKVFRCAAVERNGYPGGGIRYQKHFAHGPERGHLDGTEGRQKNVGGSESHAARQPRRQIGRREALAAEMPGKIAGPHEDDLFTLHASVIPPRFRI